MSATAITPDMGRKRDAQKEEKEKANRRRKEPFTLRLNVLLKQQLEILADRNASDLTTEISAAIRVHLEKHNLWPPPQ